jgi:hypothetical protein
MYLGNCQQWLISVRWPVASFNLARRINYNDTVTEASINTITKASKGIGIMRRIKHFVPKSTLLKIYNAIALSHFDYCSLVWDNCCDYLKNRLYAEITKQSKF